jgi:hypothetical protein
VMAWPERAHLTAHAAGTTPGQILPVQERELVSLLQQLETIPNCEHPIPENFPHATTYDHTR